MRIAVVSDEHFPHSGADTEVIVNTAAALGAEGADVTLVVPWLWRRRRLEEIIDFYGVRPTFRLGVVPGWPAPARAFRAEKLFHGLLGDLHPAVRTAHVVHSRDVLPLAVAQMAGLPWSFETYRRHTAEKPWLAPWSRKVGLERAVGAVAHNEASRLDLMALGFPEEAVVTARPGAAPYRFEPVGSREEARKRLGLPLDEKIVVYAGNIHVSKGMEQLLALAGMVPEVTFLVVGGSPEDVAALEAERDRQGGRNIGFAGHRRPSEVPLYLAAADVLFAPFLQSNVHKGFLAEKLAPHVLPGTPLKLYSYLAAGRPIVAADQPTNRELLRPGTNALLFPPDSLDVAASAVRRLLSDTALAERLAENGRELARTFTWQVRAKTMLEFFERRLSRHGK
jgi:glycosyltransferase involved in cell wall biosynthesis